MAEDGRWGGAEAGAAASPAGFFISSRLPRRGSPDGVQGHMQRRAPGFRQRSTRATNAQSRKREETAMNQQEATTREASRKDHLAYEVRHRDDAEWETIRWPGQMGKMLFHPRPERPTEPNAGIVRYEPGSHHPEHYHGFAQVWYI